MTLAAQLYRLQEIDLALEATSVSAEKLKVHLADNSTVLGAEASLKQAQTVRDDLRHRQTEMEWQSSDLAGKIEKLREKLYGGRISNSKELSGLKQDFDLLQSQRAKIDDDILVLMEQGEIADSAIADAAAALKNTHSRTAEEHQVLTAELERLNAELTRLGQERANLAAGVDTGSLSLYHQLRRQKGRAVVLLERGLCRGCGIALTTAMQQRVRSGELIRCSSCSRILCLE